MLGECLDRDRMSKLSWISQTVVGTLGPLLVVAGCSLSDADFSDPRVRDVSESDDSTQDVPSSVAEASDSGDGGGESGGEAPIVPIDEAVDPYAGTVRLVPASPLAQSTEAGAHVDHVPRIRALGSDDEPLVGVEVSFEVARGAGSVVAQEVTVTDADGYASSLGWRLGKLVGTYRLKASAPTLGIARPLTFEADAHSDFHIDLVFVSEPTPDQFKVFDTARRRWEGIILNALPMVEGNLGEFARNCGFEIDDEPYESDGITIFVDLGPIDGPNKTLGRAGPCLLRAVDGSPAFGGMTLDTADLDVLEAHGYLEAVILHEMGHVIGFGTAWGAAGLLENPSLPDHQGADTHFTGDSARVAFEEILGGVAYESGQIVPVANDSVRGSSDGHWREDVFGNELMTPILTGHESHLPVSLVTIASLADLSFYETNLRVADPFVLPSTQQAVLASNSPSEPPLMQGCELVHPTAVIMP